MSEKLKNLESAIERLKNKEYKVVFLVPDSNGVARASIAVTYQHALMLHKSGVRTIILHEKNDYIKVGDWLGKEYDDLEHVSIEGNQLEVNASDFLIIPEVYGNIVEKTAHLPCQKIVFVQSLEYMLDTYAPGKSWLDYGVLETMTTSAEAKQAIEDLIYVQNIKVVPLGVSDKFAPYTKLKKPIVAVYCKEPRKTAKLLKMFYLKYPYLRWITFRDMHGMTHDDFARNLSECILGVWSDQTSTFPLFLVEAIKCNLPVIAQMPSLLFDWTTDECATWAMTDHQMVELMAVFVKSWLEDHIPVEFNEVSKLMEGKFTMEQMADAVTTIYDEYVHERILTLTKAVELLKAEEAEESENKIETTETNEEQN